jgi:hypothetical protein
VLGIGANTSDNDSIDCHSISWITFPSAALPWAILTDVPQQRGIGDRVKHGILLPLLTWRRHRRVASLRAYGSSIILFTLSTPSYTAT